MSTIHSDVEISSHNNLKKKPNTILFYNKIKLGLSSLIRCPGNENGERDTHTICHTDRQSKDIRDTETR